MIKLQCYVTYTKYTVSQKKQEINFLPITSANINHFEIFFADRLCGKFSTDSYLNIPPYLKYIATLPCEIWQQQQQQHNNNNHLTAVCPGQPG